MWGGRMEAWLVGAYRLACSWLEGGSQVASGWLWGGLRVALGCLSLGFPQTCIPAGGFVATMRSERFGDYQHALMAL